MMFLGTKTFPKENEYSVYLAAHNGHSNAWTAMTSTNYFFDVAPDALEGALDRFAGFFYEPLFAEDCTEREINAVNSEHKKNLQHDMWRFHQLEKHLSKPGHPYGKFGTGDRKTLWENVRAAGKDPRQQLLEWWEREYCARRMKFALVGKEPVEVLEKWVRDKFEKVPVKTEGRPEVGPDGVRVAWEDSPIPEKSLGSVTFAKPVKDMKGLEITFPFPDLDHLYKTRPTHYLAHFLGHEGRGSILSYLKRKGWANGIRAGGSRGATGFDFFKTSVDLTTEGLEHYKDVALVIFKYLALLRSNPPSAVAFDEMKTLADIQFRFAEKGRASDYVSALSNYLQLPVPREKVVSSRYLLEEYNEDELSAAIKLLDPRRAVIGVTGQELPKDVEGSFDLQEPIYKTEYTVKTLPEEFWVEATNGAAIPELQIPGPNLFIPENVDVAKSEVKDPAVRPNLLRNTALSRLWHKKDDTFWNPKANVDVHLFSPVLDTTPRNFVLSRLLVDMFADNTTEDVYDADLADLSFSFNYGGDAFSLSIGGFSDKLPVYAETMLRKLMKFEVDEERFEKVRDQTKRYYQNFKLSEPYIMAHYWASYVYSEPSWTQEDKLAEIDCVTAKDVKAFGKEVFQRLFIETLVHGDTTAEGANALQDMLERVIKPRPLTDAEKAARRSLLLPLSTEHVYVTDVPNKLEPNSAIVYYLHVGDNVDPILRARLEVLGQIVSEPAFNVLRTKEQLGYIVYSQAIGMPGSCGLRVIVQSERDPVYVETRIEAFLDSVKEIIENMSEEEFGKNKQSLISKKEEKPKNLGDETRRYWGRISDRYYEFDKRQREVANLKNTTKAEVLDLYMSFIHTASPTRTKLSTYARSQFKGIKFDMASATPLVEAFTKHSVSIDQPALETLMASKPDLQAVKDFASAAVEKATELAAAAKTELKEIIESLKGTESDGKDDSVKLRDTNVFIDDINAFKAGLISSKAPTPVEPLRLDAKL
ncbi:hypothetical protein P7C73_g2681, partial [Tremellales sp. Uapishka_1]